MRPTHAGKVLTLAVTGWLIGGGAALARPKTDVVEIANGDRITCEIQNLTLGKLTVKTDDMGTISIEWDNVVHIVSTEQYDVELTTGVRHFGSLVRGEAKYVDVSGAEGLSKIPLADVVRINPVGRGFWRRLDGSLDSGFSFSQSDGQTQWTLNTAVEYRSLSRVSTLSLSSLVTIDRDTDRQTRNTLTLGTQRFLRPRWFALAFGQFQQNEQLTLNLRAVGGGGLGRHLVQSNRTVLALVGGATFTREQYEGESDRSAAEGLAGVQWRWFTYDARKLNVSLDALTFYALTGSGRVRLELASAMKSDIVGDLYWSLNAVESYTSDPPSGQRRNDLALSASIGWTF